MKIGDRVRIVGDHPHKGETGTVTPLEPPFGRALHKLRPNVVDRQRTVGGRPNQWCYVGIGLRGDDRGDLSSTDRPDFGPGQHEQRDQLDSSYLVHARARKKVDSEKESLLLEQDRENRVDRVVPVVGNDTPACDHKAREWVMFDGYVRTECAKCGTVLKPDRSPKAVTT